jgi:hypothetical protein
VIAGNETRRELTVLNANVGFGLFGGAAPLGTGMAPDIIDVALAHSAGEQTIEHGGRGDAALEAPKGPAETTGFRTGNMQGATPSSLAAPSPAEAASASAHDASLKALNPEGESQLKAFQGASLSLPLRETSASAVPRPDVPFSWLAAKSALAHPVEATGAPKDVDLAEAASSSSANGSASTVKIASEITMSPLIAPEGFRLHPDGSGHGALALEIRIATSFAAEPRTSMSSPHSSSETARHIAAQVVEAMGRNSDRAVDVILNPAELGRVRITLSHGDAGMVINVAAERAETLDLMRRHSDLLGQEFEDLGYGATDFSFSHESGDDDRHTPSSEVSVVPPDISPDQRPVVTNVQASSVIMVDRLDIRL